MYRMYLALCAFWVALPGSLTMAEEIWFESPRLSIMTGFIYEPLEPYTIHEWKETLGDEFDADQWVKDFKETGAQHLVFYDKWIDGLVFHDTKTTNFKTKRDFVRELAAACQRHELPLIFYFNAVSDGNPEFDEWSLLDRQGKPIVFGTRWPTRYQTLHSPFREKAVAQARELLSNYGPIHGIWHDIFHERLNTTSKWTAQGFEKMFGEKFDQATGTQLAEFNVRTLADWLDTVDAIRREEKQPRCIFTANGSGGAFLPGGMWTREVGARLDYLFMEGHSFANNDRLARMAWVLPKPLEINLLLNSTWFTPLEDTPPAAKYTQKQAIAATAIAVCQGASIHFALTPGHSGVFGEDLEQAKVIGDWFRQVLPVLQDAQPYADVAIVLGTPGADSPGMPSAAWNRAVELSDTLAQAGVFSRFLYDTPQGGSWPESLDGFAAILVPELAMLDRAHIDRLRQYVKKGGRLIGFGDATTLDENGGRGSDFALGDVFGGRYKGRVTATTKIRSTRVEVDSEYSDEFAGRNLVDGRSSAWASGGTPMPHWAEITLSEPTEVAAVELVSREGPYLVVDIDIEAKVQGEWKVVKSIRGAKTRAISAALDEIIQTAAVRVKILRELYQGEERQYADVESIRVLGPEGNDLSTAEAASVPLVPAVEDLRQFLASTPVAFPPVIADIEPSTAEVLGRLASADGPPAVLRNAYGDGEALLIAAPEASFGDQAALPTALAQISVGEGTLLCDDVARQRYRFILTQVDDGHVLHVIDPASQGEAFEAGEVEISLQATRLGEPDQAKLVESGTLLPMERSDGMITLKVRPDPVTSILLH